MSEDVRSKALRDAIFAVDQRLGNAEPEREWDHEDRVYDEARCHAIDAIRALCASPTPEGQGGGEREEALRHLIQDLESVGLSPERHSRFEMASYLIKARDALLSSPRVEEVRREALEEAAKVADEVQATAREEIAEEKAEEGYDPYAFGSGFLGGELTAAVNIAKAIRALATEGTKP